MNNITYITVLIRLIRSRIEGFTMSAIVLAIRKKYGMNYTDYPDDWMMWRRAPKGAYDEFVAHLESRVPSELLPLLRAFSEPDEESQIGLSGIYPDGVT